MTFLIIVLSLLLVLAVGVNVMTAIHNAHARQVDEEWRTEMLEQLDKKDKDYHALEIGFDEMEEGYQQMLLSLEDELVAYKKLFYHVNEIAEMHKTQCLPDLSEIRATTTQRLEDMWERNEDTWRAGV